MRGTKLVEAYRGIKILTNGWEYMFVSPINGEMARCISTVGLDVVRRSIDECIAIAGVLNG